MGTLQLSEYATKKALSKLQPSAFCRPEVMAKTVETSNTRSDTVSPKSEDEIIREDAKNGKKINIPAITFHL